MTDLVSLHVAGVGRGSAVRRPPTISAGTAAAGSEGFDDASRAGR